MRFEGRRLVRLLWCMCGICSLSAFALIILMIR